MQDDYKTMPFGTPSSRRTSFGDDDVTVSDATLGASLKPGDSVVNGRYEILSELGQGGMGAVFLCRDNVTDVELVLKTLPPQIARDPEAIHDVRQNFKLATRLVHQNIAVYHQLEYDGESGRWFVLMELVKGDGLNQWCALHKSPGGGVPLEEVAKILCQAASALDYAHGMNVLHRDIKPSNIMVLPDGTVKVLDFGLAVRIDPSLSCSHSSQGTGGTLGYMSPEQDEGGRQTAATDQYSLAVVAFEMLSGRRYLEVLRESIRRRRPLELPGVSEETWQALQRGMAEKPEERFPSCMAFVEALGRNDAVPSEPVPEAVRVLESLPSVSLPDESSCRKNPEEGGSQSGSPSSDEVHEVQEYGETDSPISENEGNQSPEREDTATTDTPVPPESSVAGPPSEDKDKKKKRLPSFGRWCIGILLLVIIYLVVIAVARKNFSPKLTQTGKNMTLAISYDVSLELLQVKAGSFTMGSPSGEDGRYDWEIQHRVTLTEDYWLGKYEVTQEQWQAVMGTDLREQVRKALQDDTLYDLGGKKTTLRDYWGMTRDDDPTKMMGKEDGKIAMYYVSWNDAQEFCNRLNGLYAEKLPYGYRFCLPTEAQWEYACRAETQTALYNGDIQILGGCNAPALDSIAWYGGNSSVGYEGRGWDTENWKEKQYPGGYAGPRQCGMKEHNAWGFYDMIGNVWEWCSDWYGSYSGDAVDPQGVTTGSDRVLRGGGWDDCASFCRSAFRNYRSPDDRDCNLGFRLALVPVQ